MRLIDSDALMEKLRRQPMFEKRPFDAGMLYVEKSIIDAAPTIDPEELRLKGEWIDTREYCGDYMCSNCEALYGTNQFNYCPNCGADMRGYKNAESE